VGRLDLNFTARRDTWNWAAFRDDFALWIVLDNSVGGDVAGGTKLVLCGTD
jgi:hypothetical protein